MVTQGTQTTPCPPRAPPLLFKLRPQHRHRGGSYLITELEWKLSGARRLQKLVTTRCCQRTVSSTKRAGTDPSRPPQPQSLPLTRVLPSAGGHSPTHDGAEDPLLLSDTHSPRRPARTQRTGGDLLRHPKPKVGQGARELGREGGSPESRRHRSLSESP